MSITLLIHYKNSNRETTRQPFSFQKVLVDYWWTIAYGYNLEQLQRLETLKIETKQDAQQLVQELLFVKKLIYDHDYLEINRKPWQLSIEPVRDYMTMRIDQTIPLVESAIAEWDEVAYISL
jgi:hypothetical protein